MSGSAMMAGYSIRAATVDDAPALCRLFETVFGHPRTPAYWHWKYGASAALCAGFEACSSLVVVAADGMPVAHAGAVTLPGWHCGEPIPFVQVCDVMVHPDHRGGWGQRNLFTVLLQALLDGVADRYPRAFRYGFPGERPFLLGERAGVYERIETAMECDIQGKALRLSPWRAAPLVWGDRRLDSLWSRRRQELSLALVRDGAYLRWRYASHPEHAYRLLGVSAWGRLRGWVVISEQAGYARIVDFLLPIDRVVLGLSAAASAMGGAPVIVWVRPAIGLGAQRAFRSSPIVVSHMVRQSAFPSAEVQSKLFYTMGDVDIF